MPDGRHHRRACGSLPPPKMPAFFVAKEPGLALEGFIIKTVARRSSAIRSVYQSFQRARHCGKVIVDNGLAHARYSFDTLKSGSIVLPKAQDGTARPA
jgi:hypothetical protein